VKIAVVEGDGIGREVVPAAMHVLDALGINAEKVAVDVGYGKWERTGSAITEQDVDMMKDCDCVFFGAITSPPDPNYRSALVHIRKELDLYANIRPFKPLKYLKLPCSSKEFDFIIVRENTEGMYSGIEKIEENAAYTTRVVTRRGSERIARKACELAAKRTKKITIVHKANVLKSCTLFREVCRTMRCLWMPWRTIS